MKLKSLSAKRLFLLMAAGLIISMAALTAALYLAARQTAVLAAGGALTLCGRVVHCPDAGVREEAHPLHL